jgi:hypothetical protein
MSDNGDRKNPQLPQYATPSEQRKRAREVGSARETYTWTTQVETLPGVPLAAKVPFADEPSIPWLLAAVKVALPVAENAIAVKRAEDGTAAAAAAHTETVERIRASRAALADHHDGPSEGSSALGDLVSAAMGGIGSFLGTHASTLNSHVDDLKAILDANRLGPKAAADLAAFEQLFQKLPLPEVAETFGLDSTFARMRVAGPNAGLLQGIKALPSNFPLSDEQYRAAMRYGDGDKDSLAQAGAEKRLYIVDYAALSSMVPGTSGGRQKYLWCPLALFAVPVGGRSLQPVAIQGGQDPAAHRMFLRPPSDDKRDWGWEMSKFIVQVADGNYHELFAHLARTHLVVEAFAVANHRALAPSHPLHLLLLAHTQHCRALRSLEGASPFNPCSWGWRRYAAARMCSVNQHIVARCARSKGRAPSTPAGIPGSYARCDTWSGGSRSRRRPQPGGRGGGGRHVGVPLPPPVSRRGGEPLQAWARRLRLERAAALLAHSRWPVASVGMAAGYETQAAFTRAFSRRFGVPPAAWRASATRPAWLKQPGEGSRGVRGGVGGLHPAGAPARGRAPRRWPGGARRGGRVPGGARGGARLARPRCVGRAHLSRRLGGGGGGSMAHRRGLARARRHARARRGRAPRAAAG